MAESKTQRKPAATRKRGTAGSRKRQSKRRQEVVDSAMGMADRLVDTQHDFIRKVVASAGESLDTSSERK
jgi:hypothetical protein